MTAGTHQAAYIYTLSCPLQHAFRSYLALEVLRICTCPLPLEQRKLISKLLQWFCHRFYEKFYKILNFILNPEEQYIKISKCQLYFHLTTSTWPEKNLVITLSKSCFCCSIQNICVLHQKQKTQKYRHQYPQSLLHIMQQKKALLILYTVSPVLLVVTLLQRDLFTAE